MPGRRPAICDELLKFLALRIIAVTPHENYDVCYWAWLAFTLTKSNHRTWISWRSEKSGTK